MSTARVVSGVCLLAAVVAHLSTERASFAAGTPHVKCAPGFFAPAINPSPRPAMGATGVSPSATVYFEPLAPTGQHIDVNSLKATLSDGTTTRTMLDLNQQPGSGFQVTILPEFANDPGSSGGVGGVCPSYQDFPPASPPNTYSGVGVFIRPASALAPDTIYTVQVTGKTDLNNALTGNTTWTFRTRPALPTGALTFNVDLASTTVSWPSHFFAGIGKPDFDSSALYDQEATYALMDTARAQAPGFLLQQRDFPLLGNLSLARLSTPSGTTYTDFFATPNLVREKGTRRLKTVTDLGGSSALLTLDPMIEGDRYGIPTTRLLSADYQVSDTILVCDPTHCERPVVSAVDDNAKTLTVSPLGSGWVTGDPVVNPPDGFPSAYATVRQYSRRGELAYYWARLEDEFGHDVAHGRKPHVNFFGSPLDLCRRGGPSTPAKWTNLGDDALTPEGGSAGVCLDVPKSWDQWDEFVQAVVDHLIVKYGGSEVATWYFSVGNEPEIKDYFWQASDGEFLQYYDYTVNAMLRAFEARSIATGSIKVGGLEAGGLAASGAADQILYHASPTGAPPASPVACARACDLCTDACNCGFLCQSPCNGSASACAACNDAQCPPVIEPNYVCNDSNFAGRRASRVQAFCSPTGTNKGMPLDFVSIHTYFHAQSAAARVIDVKDHAHAIDTNFDNLLVNSHETGPDWVQPRDPDGNETYRWSPYPATWGADYFRRLLGKGINNSMYAHGDGLHTTAPFNMNFQGTVSIAGQLRVQQTSGGPMVVDAVTMPFFRFAELLARMNANVAPLPVVYKYDGTALTTEPSLPPAIVSGWRSVETAADRILVYAHDPLDVASRDPGSFTVTLNLSSVRFPVVKITDYRIDRSQPLQTALDNLRNSLGGLKSTDAAYGPASNELSLVQAVLDADQLTPSASPTWVYRTADHKVTITRTLPSQGIVYLDVAEEKCGNGIVDAGEQCDDGNRTSGDCCSSACQFEPATTVCRPAAGACDVAESCTGSSGTCPADAKSTAVCRAAAGACDIAETCDGTSNNCPNDALKGAGTVCRASAGACDLQEVCSGTSAACPADAKSTAVCRPSAGPCDLAESCDGVGNDCPTDGFVAAGTVCRASAGVCDLAETCTGSSAACPTDAKSTAQCRASTGPCDPAENCDGANNTCPADAYLADNTTCDDTNPCTSGDHCASGVCTGTCLADGTSCAPPCGGTCQGCHCG